ncbi:hypothetical protein BN903_55 [Halorubrum sp. AJ67]|nr:hypothetical protein BN903_55 [Halorubrum sp. AJ67]
MNATRGDRAWFPCHLTSPFRPLIPALFRFLGSIPPFAVAAPTDGAVVPRRPGRRLARAL